MVNAILERKLPVQISFTIRLNLEVAGVLACVTALSIPFKPNGVSAKDFRGYWAR